MKSKALLILLLTVITYSHYAKTEINPSLIAPVIYPVETNYHLKNKSIFELVQDDQGFIWLGTDRGIFRYDGYEYKQIEYASNTFDFSNIYVRSLLADKNNLWIGTMSDGMFHMDLTTYEITQFTYDENSANTIGGNQINGLALDNSGALWLSHSFGLDKFIPANGKFFHYFSSATTNERYNNYLLELAFDSKEQLWISTGNGLAKFDVKSQSFSLVHLQHNNSANQLAKLKDVTVQKIFTARDGQIWLATHKNGTYIISKDEQKLTHLSSNLSSTNRISTTVVQPTDDEVWISSTTGIEIRNADTGQLKSTLLSNPLDRFSLPKDNIFAMLVSRSGLLWIGVRGSGLYYHAPQNKKFIRIKNNIPGMEDISSSLMLDAIKITETKILVLTNKTSVFIDFISGIIQPLVSSKIFNAQGISAALKIGEDLLVGTRAGDLFKYSMQQQTFTKLNFPVLRSNDTIINEIHPAYDGHIWIARSNSLYLYDLNNQTSKVMQNSDNQDFTTYTRSLTVDRKDRLWVSTISGIGIVEKGSIQVKMYRNNKNTQGTLSNDNIYQVVENINGEIYVITRSGINKLTTDSSDELLFEPFIESITQKHKDIEKLYFDSKDNLWYGAKYQLTNKENLISESEIADGLLLTGKGVSLFESSDGNLVNVTTRNIFIIQPENHTEWNFKPTVMVTDFKIDNTSYPLTIINEGINLDAANKTFSVRFSAFDFSSPRDNQYRYKLEGYDNNWISSPVDIRQAKYTSLSPGSYSLLLDGTNRKGQWSDKPLRLKVTVEPEYYQTIWFKILILLFIVIITNQFFKWRLRAVKLRDRKEYEKKQAIQKAEMLSELMDQKNKMLADVTHDLRTPLSTIKLLIEALEEGVIENSEKSYRSVKLKLSNLNKMVGDLYQLSLVETSNLVLQKSDVNINNLLIDVIDAFKPLATNNKILISSDIQSSNAFNVNADPDRLTQVFSNVLENCISYTEPEGKIVVSTVIDNKKIVIVIEDSAPGVDDNELEQLFTRLYRAKATRDRSSTGSGLGLSIVESIVKAHDGTVSAQHSVLGGLCLRITFPII